MWVFDATPLIYLAKAGQLSTTRRLDGPRLIPRRVYGETVTTGLKGAYPDARRIERCVENGHFEVKAVERGPLFERLEANEALSDADRAVLTLAADRDAIAVMDERHGRSVAETEGVETRGTAYLVLSLAKNGHVSTDEARETIDAMIDHGWHCSPTLYAKIVGKLDAFA